MANKKEDEGFVEPELMPKSGSEIEALIDLDATGSDGITRPVFINQFEEEVLALTYEDTVRLYKFLGRAIKYVKEYRDKIIQ